MRANMASGDAAYAATLAYLNSVKALAYFTTSQQAKLAALDTKVNGANIFTTSDLLEVKGAFDRILNMRSQ